MRGTEKIKDNETAPISIMEDMNEFKALLDEGKRLSSNENDCVFYGDVCGKDSELE